MTTQITNKPLGWAAAALVLALLQGCATGPNANPADPLEPLNRTVFNFNDGVDRAVLKPVATVYKDVTPAPIRTGVASFFGNISDVWSVANNLLQFKPEAAADSLFRVTVNTLWGLGGIFDVASEMKIPKHSEDFGRTLGYWGVASGPYLVLPLLGPSTVRDSVGSLVDTQGDLVDRSHNIPVRNSLITLRAVDKRASLLSAGDLLEQASLDKYSFARDIYLQRHSRPNGSTAGAPEERYDLPEAAPGAGAPAVPDPAVK
ncbi:MAG: VacJ family lipoprotein [Polaromonas sp.]|uniref:MlaA family lipoprotein n=1 Tax=Polaromonas sp. TaxID=1869339 RepID=UPI00179561F9|nr:VacJ family lipoprotein [Polaromonas sp.]NMM11806.1 VacJ family lipoprotein [Polaromonas sp.]